MLKNCLLASYLLFAATFSVLATDTQVLYVYHNKPPYITNLEASQGLYFDIAALINAHHSDITVEVRFVPRKRLDKLLEKKDFKGFVFGVNPAWFDDKKKQKYLWSSPLIFDTDEFISHVDQPFEYYHPSSLSGNYIGTMAGYYYRHLEQAKEYSNIRRVDVNSEQALLEMVIKKRVNIAIVSRSTTEYLSAKHGWRDKLHFSQTPHETYYRAVLAPKKLQAEFDSLEKVLESPKFKEQLARLLKSYHLVYNLN
ncbi:transporter substrate-binding domain-containing protein [Pseudoalteromonas piscicida]|uniref:transporter substrate-binding domain-containing protein n=1 Tax=Pseudoalteromonas piscicida TaxID=43662 RepID=UPI001F5B4988|nr:transporter substrate-binding domain-containing protein [Pseudoalteromonas piscicida]